MSNNEDYTPEDDEAMQQVQEIGQKIEEKEKVKVYCLECGVFIKEIDKPFDPRDLGVPITLSMWPRFEPAWRWCQACKDKNPPIPGRITVLP